MNPSQLNNDIVKVNNVYILTEEAYNDLIRYKSIVKDVYGTMRTTIGKLSSEALILEKLLNDEE